MERQLHGLLWIWLSAATLAAQRDNTADRLARELRDPERRIDAASRLYEMGPTAVTPLVREVMGPNGDAQRAALRVLLELGPVATPCLPDLVAYAQQAGRNVPHDTWSTIAHLALFDPEHGVEQVVTQEWIITYARFDGRVSLGELSDQYEHQNRQCAAQAMAARAHEFHDDLAADAQLRAEIIDRLGRRSRLPRSPGEHSAATWSARALARLAPDDPSSLIGHILELDHPHRERRMQSLRSIAALGTGSKVVHQALQGALADPDRRVVMEAITTIGMLGTHVRGLAGHLQPLTASDHGAAAAVARSALRRLQAAGVDANLAISYHDNGRMASRGAFDGDAKTGTWQFFYDNGYSRSTGTYVAGREQGSWTFWYSNGAVSAAGTYDDGKPTGSWVFRHDNGVVARRGAYEHGEPIGNWRIYDRYGRDVSSGRQRR